MGGVSFSFNKNFLYLLLVPLVGLQGLVWGFGAGCGGLLGGRHGLSDASVLEMDRMVCSCGRCVWLVPLFPWSSVWAECRVWYLDLGSASAVLESDLEQV